MERWFVRWAQGLGFLMLRCVSKRIVLRSWRRRHMRRWMRMLLPIWVDSIVDVIRGFVLFFKFPMYLLHLHLHLKWLGSPRFKRPYLTAYTRISQLYVLFSFSIHVGRRRWTTVISLGVVIRLSKEMKEDNIHLFCSMSSWYLLCFPASVLI